MSRESLYVEIRRLREDEGLIWREIGARLGFAKTTVCDIYLDPTGEKSKARKERYSTSCDECGKTINPGGLKRGSGLCRACLDARTRRGSKRWILDSFAEWAATFGAPPSSVDWNPGLARATYCGWKADRHARTGRPWPSPTLVIEHYGTWNDGLRAAGFAPLPKSEHWLGHEGRALREADERQAA